MNIGLLAHCATNNIVNCSILKGQFSK